MHHELMACVYAVVVVLFFSVHDLSAPFDDTPFAFGMYMTLAGALMLYEMLRTRYDWNDVLAFMCMQWSTYVLCGGTKYPYWMAAYGAYVSVYELVVLAESRLARLDEEVMRHGLHVVNLHNFSRAPLRVETPTPAQCAENKVFREFRALRAKGETAVGLSDGERILWRLSDDTGVLYPRETRRWTVTVPFVSMLFLYYVWWNAFSWYTVVDLCMLTALVSEHTTLRFVVYHLGFLLALVYGRSDAFQL